MSTVVNGELRKQCSQCEDWKLVEDFNREKKKPDGLQSRCRLCHRAGVKEHKAQKKLESQKNPGLTQQAKGESNETTDL